MLKAGESGHLCSFLLTFAHLAHQVSPATFAHLVHSLQAFAGGRVLALLEGGYFLPSLAGDNEDHHRHQCEKRPQ